MPTYRKLHVKTVESLDVNDMPDDFTRLMWVLLPLGLCREGRGLDNTTWVRSKIFPVRLDVTDTMITDALTWYADRGMIKRYTVNGRAYFYITTWHRYQGKTDKEGPTSYPAPPDLLPTYSVPTQTVSEKDRSHSPCESACESTPDQHKTGKRTFAKGHRNDAALNAYMELTGQPFENEEAAKAVDQTVGLSQDDLQLWRAVIKGCLLSGYRASNVQCMLDHYGRREIPGGKHTSPGPAPGPPPEPVVIHGLNETPEWL